MTKSHYVPRKGDIVWLSFDPTKGREQKGERPAVVVSSKSFNENSGLAYVCPVTSTDKSYPFRVPVKGKKVAGFAMVDHLKSIDWNDRKVKFVEKSVDIMPFIHNCILAIMKE